MRGEGIACLSYAQGAVRRYRQAHRDGHPFFVAITLGVIVYVFAGFFVYWLITGSGTIGDGGTVSDIGGFVWFGPLFAWGLVCVVGPRGPFRRFWLEPIVVSTTSEQLTWTQGDTMRTADWDAIATVRGSFLEMAWSERYALVAAGDGSIIAKLPMRLTDMDQPGRGRNRTSLMDAVVAARPDLYRFDGGIVRRVVAS